MGSSNGFSLSYSLWFSRCLTACRVHVLAGGLKTGPIFKRFADMRNKCTRWIHCYCNIAFTFSVLFTDLKMLKFSSQICDKKINKFSKHAFVRVSCTFCQNIVQIVFSFSTCQIVRVGWGGGKITFLELAHMFDAMQIPCVRKGLGK